ncbi:MAG: TIGR00159 family protein [Armatimonadetes bacterium]|nr:TIGR00159 family protein [Armatimonadota bacterium]
MNELLHRFRDLLTPGWQGLVSVADIFLVTYLVYRLLKLVRGTRAWRVVLGVMVFIIAWFVSDLLGLTTFHTLLDKAMLLAPVALAILFLPELRQAIEGLARFGLSDRLVGADNVIGGDALEEVVAAVAEMAEQRIGALLVVERGTQLDDVAENGIPVRAQVTAPLLGAIFNEGSPLHDGAAIIRNGQILAAACRLPLSENPRIDPHFHMRHRAGLGISEQADCVAVIVSEERGQVSIAIDGRFVPLNSFKELRDLLNQELRGGLGRRRSRRNRKQDGSPLKKVGLG